MRTQNLTPAPTAGEALDAELERRHAHFDAVTRPQLDDLRAEVHDFVQQVGADVASLLERPTIEPVMRRYTTALREMATRRARG